VREVATNKRQVMALVDAAQTADALRGLRIADSTAERVARIGRVSDDTAIAQDVRRAANQARLRMRRMKMKH
jgi:hypothetical protein